MWEVETAECEKVHYDSTGDDVLMTIVPCHTNLQT